VKYEIALICQLAVAQITFAQGPVTRPASPALSLEVETSHTAFIGLPLLVAVTITNHGDKDVDIPMWHVMEAHPPLTFRARGTDGKAHAAKPTPAAFAFVELETDRGMRRILKPTCALKASESLRCAANLAWTFNEELQMRPGLYQLQFVLWRDLGEVIAESKPVSITFVDRPDDQMTALSAKAVIGYYGVSRKKGVVFSPADFGSIGQPELRSTLAFASLMDEAASVQDAADVPIADYDKMIEPYLLPEVRMLEWVCLRARQQKDRADEIKVQLIDKYPSMRSRIALGEKDRSFLRLSPALTKRLKDVRGGETADSQPSP
jgi:hypothetical protein